MCGAAGDERRVAAQCAMSSGLPFAGDVTDPYVILGVPRDACTILQLTRASRLAGVAGFNLACICAASAYSGRHIEVCNLKKYNSKVSYNFFVPI